MKNRYNKIKLTLGELVHFLQEDHFRAIVYDHNKQVIYDGTIMGLRNPDVTVSTMLDFHVDMVNEDSVHITQIFLEPLPRVGDAIIEDFPRKEMYVAELLHFLDHKEIVTIIDRTTDPEDLDTDIIFKGRAEDLEHTEDGVLHRTCLMRVQWFESTPEGLVIYV